MSVPTHSHPIFIITSSRIRLLKAMFGRKTPQHEDAVPAWPEAGVEAHDGHTLDASKMDSDTGVKRGLKNRHLSMMALAGIIGPGLLVGSGGALSNGGPASLIIGFGVIGIIAFSIMQSLGEMTTLYPGGGAFISLADRMVDKAFAVAVGWNYFIIWAAVLANEYNVISSILVFWSDKVPLWGYFLILWTVFLGFQLLGVEAFRRGRVLAGTDQTTWSRCLLHLRNHLRFGRLDRTAGCLGLPVLAQPRIIQW